VGFALQYCWKRCEGLPPEPFWGGWLGDWLSGAGVPPVSWDPVLCCEGEVGVGVVDGAVGVEVVPWAGAVAGCDGTVFVFLSSPPQADSASASTIAAAGAHARAILYGMSAILNTIGDGLWQAFLMAYEVWWALVLGFAISAIVQAWVPRERIEASLAGGGAAPIARATALGAASSSCSYAAIAIAKSLFQKGASAAAALAFQFASTNLVWELGLVLWVLLGWQFTLAEYVGGIVMIVLMSVLLRLFVSPQLEERARERARQADTGHQHHHAGERMTWRERLTSVSAWSDVAQNFRGDWQMLWKEITIGFFLAGFIGLLGNDFFNGLFIKDAPPLLEAIENVIVGPIIAVLSFVCSVGNIPLAAVLWSGGISFAGVMAFIFADLIVLPIIAIYRKYYGWKFAIRITVLMFVTMVVAALIVDGIFSGAGLIPHTRPSRDEIFGSVEFDYKLWLNLFGLIVFAALFWITMRRGATDPVCGMKVDRAKALRSDALGGAHFFCSEGCRDRFEADPQRYAGKPAAPGEIAPSAP
jgi:uncharacterized membrane protein YraQ (UPF0718 family)